MHGTGVVRGGGGGGSAIGGWWDITDRLYWPSCDCCLLTAAFIVAISFFASPSSSFREELLNWRGQRDCYQGDGIRGVWTHLKVFVFSLHLLKLTEQLQ